MRIAIVTWPINDVGGINSWCKNFILGLNALGVRSDTFYATPQRTFQCDPKREIVKKRCSVLKASHLSYENSSLNNTLKTLEDYDLMLFLHPSPHPTKAVLSHKCAENWKILYESVPDIPKLVIFHDANWRKTNDWFADVAEHVDAIIAAQAIFNPSVQDYPADCPKTWEYFPLDLTKADDLRRNAVKKKRAVVATQWLKWKNHHKLLPELPKVEFPVHLYGNGMEYCNLKAKGCFNEVISENHDTGESNDIAESVLACHEFFGYVPYVRVQEAIANATVSIDLSTKGYTNMTHWEPLTLGTVSMIEKRVLANEWCKIPEDCCQPYDLDDIAEEINGCIKRPNSNAKIIAKAYKFVHRKCDSVMVAARVLKWLHREQVLQVPRILRAAIDGVLQ